MRQKPTKTKKAFTLVELTLAMAFLAVLLITIAILIIRIIGIYQSGISLRAISATGRELIDDFSRSIAGSPIVDISYDQKNDITYKYYFQKTANIEINGEPRANAPVAGIFCTGLYTYIWNTPYALVDPSNINNDAFIEGGENENVRGFTYTYFNADGTPLPTLTNFRLLRIPDSTRYLCIEGRKDNNGKIDPEQTNFTAPTTQPTAEPIELLSSAEDALAIYDLRIFPASSNRVTGHVFYSGTFILATLRGGVDIFTSGDYCTASVSDSLNTDFNYCAINKFNFAMRATGQTTDDNMYGNRGDGTNR